MRVLIADDEPIARQVLRQELSAVSDVEIAGEAEDGQAALERARFYARSFTFWLVCPKRMLRPAECAVNWWLRDPHRFG